MRRKVLQLVDSFQQGGTERQAVQLARLLHESGSYEVHFACLNGTGILRREVERLELGEIGEYPLTSFHDRNTIVQLRRLVKFLRDRKIDIIHTHDYSTNIFGMAAAFAARTPARIASRRQSRMRDPKRRFLSRAAYELAHGIVANCEMVRQQLLEEGHAPGKVVTVHNGLDLERLTPLAAARRDDLLETVNLPRDGRRLVTIVANLHFRLKDHATFLRAARRVREVVPDAAFVIAGEGKLLEPMREYAAELGLADATFFLGRCGKVAELLSASEVCVLSSKTEGFSNSILEYMAAARPVVVTDVGGAREAVTEGETGYLVNVGDDETMAARIASLLNDPVRARTMGERGRSVVEANFSCAAQFERTDRLYHSLLTRAERARPHPVKGARPEEGVSGVDG